MYCFKKKSDATNFWQLTNYTTNFDIDNYGKMFVMSHRTQSMKMSTSGSNHKLFVDLCPIITNGFSINIYVTKLSIWRRVMTRLKATTLSAKVLAEANI